MLVIGWQVDVGHERATGRPALYKRAWQWFRTRVLRRKPRAPQVFLEHLTASGKIHTLAVDRQRTAWTDEMSIEEKIELWVPETLSWLIRRRFGIR